MKEILPHENYKHMRFEKIEKIARTAHEILRLYNNAIGENCLPSWEDLDTERRDTTYFSVRMVLYNPDIDPIKVHKIWVRLKKNDGWSFGSKIDFDKKLHPCLVNWDDLPIKEKSKDFIYFSVIKGLSSVLF